uniref:hypothetical protein n=1 Tax=Candidatus Thiosymbion oneisti TaxID=589554 RepID=UPI00105EBDEB
MLSVLRDGCTSGLRRQLWWLVAILLWSTRILAGSDYPPLVPDGEPVPDPERLIAELVEIDPSAGFTAVD